MNASFRDSLIPFAKRMVDYSPRCKNEESTKLFLILPMLNFLGYDTQNPDEVCPEHSADFSEKYKNKVDFAIIQENKPVIAIECKAVGSTLKDDRGQLKSYFNAATTVKLGILTDGIIYEFFADSDEPNIMDSTAFLTCDMREIAKGKIEDAVLDGLKGLQKATFDPINIGAEAKKKLIFLNFVQQINELSEIPSDDFTRMLLKQAGIQFVRTNFLSEYKEITRTAFRHFIDMRILQRLDIQNPDQKEKPESTQPLPSPPPISDAGIQTTDIEIEVFNYTKQRLAFLVKEEALFNAISHIEYRDYIGKFIVYYKKERKGRLFDFVSRADTKYCFQFPDGHELRTNSLSDLDGPLLNLFRTKFNEEAKAPAS